MRSRSSLNTLMVCLALAVSPSAIAGKVSPFIGGGLMSGGDTLASFTVSYSGGDSSTQDIEAGGFGLLMAGATLSLTEDNGVEAQLGLGYFNDGVSAKNGSADFTRYPLEVLLFKYVNDHARLGGGVTYHLNPTFSCNVCGGLETIKFENALGFVLEFDWLFRGRATDEHTAGAGANWWLGARVVNIDYTPSSIDGYSVSGAEISGNHIGILAGVNF